MPDMIVPTVRIVAPVTDSNPNGFIVINASDFVDGMTRYEEPQAARPTLSLKKSDK